MDANRRGFRGAIGVFTAVLVAGCGGGGGGDDASSVGSYLEGLPAWAEFSPPLPSTDPVVAGKTTTSSEQVQKPAGDGYVSQQYFCKSTPMSLTRTPEKIVTFSPDRELLWPGALIQGKSHRDGIGSLVGLPIRERVPIKVSIPSLASADNFRVIDSPDQASVSSAIGDMIESATASGLTPPSSIDFTMRDYKSDQEFALEAGLSAKYLSFSVKASASVETAANERTVMVHYVEKMFEAVVEPPQTPGGFFSDAFTKAKLDEQVQLGRIGPNNLPVYVSNVVYGRMMAFTFTSTASLTDIKAALDAAYKGFVDVDVNAKAAYKKTLSEAKIAITSIGGPTTATVEMIASGDWRDYFGTPAPLTSAYPIASTFRNLGDGSIASVSEVASYNVKECEPAGGGDFVLDSFESQTTLWPGQAASPDQPSPVVADWHSAATADSIFYGYEAVTHTNLPLTNSNWIYDVGYVVAPPYFTGDKSAYYGGELSFWYKPAEVMKGQQVGSTRYCYTYWYWYFPPVWETRCVDLPVALPADVPLQHSDQVYVYDAQTTADQIVLRGGGDESNGTMLTLTYNPPESQRGMSQGWQKLVLKLSNVDGAGRLLCQDDPHGCWMAEDRIATEAEIQYLLRDVRSFRIRASYPVYRTELCTDDPPPSPGAACKASQTLNDPVPLGFVGGYFDEIKITTPAL